MAPSSRRGGAALLALAVVALVPRAARSVPLKVTAYTCQDSIDAFKTLSRQIANATKPQAQSMILTFACNGTFDGCGTSFLAYSPPALPKQPKITITMQPESECRKGDARPLLTADSASVSMFTIISSDIGASPMDITVRDLSFDGPAFLFKLPQNVTTSVTFKNIKLTGYRLEEYPLLVETASRTTISGSVFHNTTGEVPIRIRAGQATITGNTFTGTDSGFIELVPRVPNAKFTVSRNTFSNAAPENNGAVFLNVAQGPGASFKISGNTFDAGSMNNPVICTRSLSSPVNTTKITLSGNKGIKQTKPLGTTQSCNLAAIDLVPLS